MSATDENASGVDFGPGGHDIQILTSDDGEPVALHDLGGEGPTLLLGHGNGLNAGMWAAALPHLQTRYRCYGIDLRGHGACRPTQPDYSVERRRFAEDVLRCVDELNGPVLYAGHSLGGAAAVYALLARPEAFHAMWLFEPVVVPETLARPEGSAPSFLIDSARRRRMEFVSLEDAIERFSSKPPFSNCDPVAVRGYVAAGTRALEGGGVRLSCEGEDEARVFESGQPLDFGLLAEVQTPVVVAAGAAGDEVHAIPARVAPLIAEALGNCRFEQHADLSHFGPMEAPARISASIVAHFESV